MPFFLHSSASLSCDECALPYIRVATLFVFDFSASHSLQILSEIRQCRLLDVFQCKATHRLNAGSQQPFAWAVANPGDEYSGAVVDGVNHGFQAFLFSEAALTVVIHPAMTDKLGSRSADLINLKLFGVTEVLVDATSSLGCNGDQNGDIAICACERLQLFISCRNHSCALPFHIFLIGLTDRQIVVNVHLHDLFSREFIAAVLA